MLALSRARVTAICRTGVSRATYHLPPLLALGIGLALAGFSTPMRAQQQTGATPNVSGSDSIPPDVMISPASATQSTPTVSVTIDWCDNVSLQSERLHGCRHRELHANGWHPLLLRLPASLNLSNGQSKPFTVTYTAGMISDTGSVIVTASGISDLTATITATVSAAHYVTVLPKGILIAGDPQLTDTLPLTITNGGTDTATYLLSTSCQGGPAPSSTANRSTALPSRRWPPPCMQFHLTTGVGTTDHVALLATDSAVSTVRDSGWATVPVNTHTVSVTPDGGSAIVDGGTTHTVTFTVTNTGTGGAVYKLTATCDGSVTCTTQTATDSIGAGQSIQYSPTYTAGGNQSTGHVRLVAAYAGDAAISDSGGGHHHGDARLRDGGIIHVPLYLRDDPVHQSLRPDASIQRS